MRYVWVRVYQLAQGSADIEVKIVSAAQVAYQWFLASLQEVGVGVGILQCVAALQETSTSVHTPPGSEVSTLWEVMVLLDHIELSHLLAIYYVY